MKTTISGVGNTQKAGKGGTAIRFLKAAIDEKLKSYDNVYNELINEKKPFTVRASSGFDWVRMLNEHGKYYC